MDRVRDLWELKESIKCNICCGSSDKYFRECAHFYCSTCLKTGRCVECNLEDTAVSLTLDVRMREICLLIDTLNLPRDLVSRAASAPPMATVEEASEDEGAADEISQDEDEGSDSGSARCRGVERVSNTNKRKAEPEVGSTSKRTLSTNTHETLEKQTQTSAKILEMLGNSNRRSAISMVHRFKELVKLQKYYRRLVDNDEDDAKKWKPLARC